MKHLIYIVLFLLVFLAGCSSSRKVQHHKKRKPHGCNCSKWSYNQLQHENIFILTIFT